MELFYFHFFPNANAFEQSGHSALESVDALIRSSSKTESLSSTDELKIGKLCLGVVVNVRWFQTKGQLAWEDVNIAGCVFSITSCGH